MKYFKYKDYIEKVQIDTLFLKDLDFTVFYTNIAVNKTHIVIDNDYGIEQEIEVLNKERDFRLHLYTGKDSFIDGRYILNLSIMFKDFKGIERQVLLIKFGFLDDVKSLSKDGIEKEKELLREWLLEEEQDIINFIYEE